MSRAVLRTQPQRLNASAPLRLGTSYVPVPKSADIFGHTPTSSAQRNTNEGGESGSNKPLAWRLYSTVAPHRTQEVAGSSPASPISEGPLHPRALVFFAIDRGCARGLGTGAHFHALASTREEAGGRRVPSLPLFVQLGRLGITPA